LNTEFTLDFVLYFILGLRLIFWLAANLINWQNLLSVIMVI